MSGTFFHLLWQAQGEVGFGHFFGWQGAVKHLSHSAMPFQPKGGLRPG